MRRAWSVAECTSSFMSVRSSRPEMVFFIGLNFDTYTSMSPAYSAIASSSVAPTYASGGCTKHADGTCATGACAARLETSVSCGNPGY